MCGFLKQHLVQLPSKVTQIWILVEKKVGFFFGIRFFLFHYRLLLGHATISWQVDGRGKRDSLLQFPGLTQTVWAQKSSCKRHYRLLSWWEKKHLTRKKKSSFYCLENACQTRPAHLRKEDDASEARLTHIFPYFFAYLLFVCAFFLLSRFPRQPDSFISVPTSSFSLSSNAGS